LRILSRFALASRNLESLAPRLLGKDSHSKPFQLLAGIRSVKVAPKMSQNLFKYNNPVNCPFHPSSLRHPTTLHALHALLDGQEHMISLQIQRVAGTGENPSLASLHRKIAAACRKRRLPIPSYGTVLRRLQAYDARASGRKPERPARSQSTVQRKKRSTH